MVLKFVDHESGLPSFDDAGDVRILACLPPLPRGPESLPAFGVEPIPRSEWKEFSLSEWVTRILDQDGQGSCVGHGADGALETCRHIAGASPIALSPCYLYGNINRGRDAGAVVSDALDWLLKSGTCLESEVGPKNIWRRNWPSSADSTAKRFRLGAGYSLGRFDDVATALFKGFLPVYGILIGENFEPDADGWIPDRPAGRKGGHCMYGVGVKKGRRGQWGIETINSWGQRWGKNGKCWIPESCFAGDYLDAFAVQAAKEDPLEVNRIPKADGRSEKGEV